jgi:hypothetical protein
MHEPADEGRGMDQDPRIKVVRDALGGTEIFVRCEIHGSWFWLKVGNHVSYLSAGADNSLDTRLAGTRTLEKEGHPSRSDRRSDDTSDGPV